VQTGKLVAPADGPVSWTTRADLAEAAAAILASESRFDGPTPPLTTTDTVDLQQVATVLTELSGRTVLRVVVGDESFVERLIEHGIPEPFARLFLGSYHASRRGEFAFTDPTLQRLIGRPPTALRDALSSRH
jgi:NAD(P)H dehydrogenase (quinone)